MAYAAATFLLGSHGSAIAQANNGGNATVTSGGEGGLGVDGAGSGGAGGFVSNFLGSGGGGGGAGGSSGAGGAGGLFLSNGGPAGAGGAVGASRADIIADTVGIAGSPGGQPFLSKSPGGAGRRHFCIVESWLP